MEKIVSPLISVIIPIYNVEPYLRQALDSVVNQTYRNLQIILVDDGSPDNCGKICDEYARKDSRIQVIHKENGGVSSARNAGIDATTGEWIFFMDPDDWIELDALELCLDTATKMNTDLVTFNYDRFSENKTWTAVTQRRIKLEVPRLYETMDYDDILNYRTFGCICFIVARTSLIKGSILFDTDLRLCEDVYFKYLLWQKISSFCMMPNVLYHYRIRPGSANNKRSFQKMYDENVIAYKKLQLLFETGTFPEKTELMERTIYVSKIIGLLTGVLIDDPMLSFREKKDTIRNVVRMKEFQMVLNENEPRMVSMSAKIFFLLRKCPITATYAIYFLRKTQHFFRKI